jgi:predicted Zn-dependent protease
MFFRHALTLTTAAAVCATAAFTADFKFGKADLELLEQAELMDRKMEREGLVHHDAAMVSYVNEVGRSMLPAGVAPERVQWRFLVLRDPSQNSFALPNGSIYINSGLISLLENEDQLASVLAHEITHVTDRHSYLHFRDYRRKSTLSTVAELVSRYAPRGSSWGIALGLMASNVPAMMTALIDGYSRELERNADIYCFNKLIEGGYDPNEMPSTFRLLERRDEVGVTRLYYNDHPKLEDRIKYSSGLLNSRGIRPLPADILDARRMKFLNLTEAVARHDLHLAILSRRPRTALARAMKLINLHPDSPDNLYSVA